MDSDEDVSERTRRKRRRRHRPDIGAPSRDDDSSSKVNRSSVTEGRELRRQERERRREEMAAADEAREVNAEIARFARMRLPHKPVRSGQVREPSPWVSARAPDWTVYCPQVNDFVVYCRMGHMEYLQAVERDAPELLPLVTRIRDSGGRDAAPLPIEVAVCVLEIAFEQGPPALARVRLEVRGIRTGTFMDVEVVCVCDDV